MAVLRILGNRKNKAKAKFKREITPQACRSHLAVRQLAKAADVVALTPVLASDKWRKEAERKLREVEEQFLVKLPTSVWYGAFRLDAKVRAKRRLAYQVTCMCGKSRVLTTEQLVTALLQHVGCSNACCQQRTLLRLFWGTLPDSLMVQWKLLQACYSDRLPSYLGGTLDDVYERDLEFGFVRAFKEIFAGKIDLAKPEFRWITPLNPELPFTSDNLFLSLYPWKGITNLNGLRLRIAGQQVKILDLSQSLQVDVDTILDVIVNESVNPDDLAIHILKKGATA